MTETTTTTAAPVRYKPCPDCEAEVGLNPAAGALGQRYDCPRCDLGWWETDAATAASKPGRRNPVDWWTDFTMTMPRRDRERWENATTMPQLGELTAWWLEGRIGSQPGYQPRCGPDPETEHLIPVLARANRGGYVTDVSQPGLPPRGGWDQRAAVEGWCDTATMRRVRRAALDAGLLVRVARPGRGRRYDHSRAVPVTRDTGREVTSFGSFGSVPPRRLTGRDEGISDEMAGVLRSSWRVTVVDPEWGRDDVLWPALDEALHRRADV